MAKKKRSDNRKRIIREDRLRNRLPDFYKGRLKHGAFYWMRKTKEGQMPPGNTNVRKSLDAIELCLIEHFGGELNGPQQIQLNLLRPLLVYWLLHPGVGEDGKLVHDFKWVHGRIEAGLKALNDLATPKAPDKAPDISQYLAARKQEEGSE